MKNNDSTQKIEVIIVRDLSQILKLHQSHNQISRESQNKKQLKKTVLHLVFVSSAKFTWSLKGEP